MHHLNANSNPSVTIGLAPGHYVTIEGSATVYRIEAGVEPVTLGAVTTIGPYATTASFRIDAAIGDVVVSDPKIYTLNVDNWAAESGFPLSKRLMHVGARSQLPTGTTASARCAARKVEFARDNISEVTLGYVNYYLTSSGIANNANTNTLYAKICYPTPTDVIGTITFGGAASITMTAGQRLVLSDKCTLSTTIPRGARYYIETYQGGTTFLTGSGYRAFGALGEGFLTTNGTGWNQTVLGTGWTPGYVGGGFGPTLILTETSIQSVMTLGDSIGIGANAANDTLPYVGVIDPFIPPDVGNCNMSVGGFRLMHWADGTMDDVLTNLSPYFSAVISQCGVNDLTESASLQNLRDWEAAIAAKLPGKRRFRTTVTPISTSTDSFATTANQTTHASNSVRVGFNALVRAGLFGTPLEIADAWEHGRDSGLWRAPSGGLPAAITPDGKHPNNAAFPLIKPYFDMSEMARRVA